MISLEINMTTIYVQKQYQNYMNNNNKIGRERPNFSWINTTRSINHDTISC